MVYLVLEMGDLLNDLQHFYEKANYPNKQNNTKILPKKVNI